MRAVAGTGPFALAEGPLWWPDGTLTWVDVTAGTLHEGRPRHGEMVAGRVHRAAPPLGSAVRRRDGGFLLAAGRAVRWLDAGGAVTAETPVEPDPAARLNDGKCDPAGRFWVGSLSPHEGRAGLYRVDPGGAVTRMLSGLTASNGLGWSPDGATMYVTDTGARAVDAFRFDPATGALDDRRRLIRVADGKPDGLCVDDDGCLWVAIWDGAAVHRYGPDGGLIEAHPAPVARPTSCCLADGALWVTAAGAGLFTLDTGATARPADTFAG